MKKLVSSIVALLALLIFATPTHAAGAINAAEQSIIDEYSKGVTVSGKTFNVRGIDSRQAENYMKAVNLTEAQAQEVIKNMRAARELVEAQSLTVSKATDIRSLYHTLPASVKSQFKQYLVQAGNALNLKVSFGQGEMWAVDANGNVVYYSNAQFSDSVVKATGFNFQGTIFGFAGLMLVAGLAAFTYRKSERASL